MKTVTEAWLGTKWKKHSGNCTRDSQRGREGSLFIEIKIEHGWTRLHGSMAWRKWVEKNVNWLIVTFGQARKRVLACMGRPTFWRDVMRLFKFPTQHTESLASLHGIPTWLYLPGFLGPYLSSQQPLNKNLGSVLRFKRGCHLNLYPSPLSVLLFSIFYYFH